MGDHNPHGDGSTIEAAHATDHDDHGAGGHGHGDDPNAGVVRATPPTPAWVLTAALIGLVTILTTLVLAVAINDAIPSDVPRETGVEGEQDPGGAAEEDHGAEAEPEADAEAETEH